MNSILKKVISNASAVILILTTISSCGVSQHNDAGVPAYAASPAVSPSSYEYLSPVITASPSEAVSPAPSPAHSADPEFPADVVNYLSSNKSEIVFDAGGNYKSGLEAIGTMDYDVFLSGETHATKKNYDMQFALVQYLHQTAGVRYILLESGFAAAAYLNMYIQNGDLNIPKLIMMGLKGTPSYSKELYEFWQKLYRYNQSLPTEERLTVIGIDIEHQTNTAVLYLQTLVQMDPVPPEIADTIKNLRVRTKSISDVINLLHSDIEINGSHYKDYLGDDYFDFVLTVKNCMATLEAFAVQDDSLKFAEKREAAIYNNFISVYDHFGGGKFFGQLGTEHVFQSACDSPTYTSDFKRFAMYLEQGDSPVSKKICTIRYSYVDSFMMYGAEKIDISDNLLPQPVLSTVPDGSGMTLFDLTESCSPFSETPYFMWSDKAGPTTDYFQYLVVIKNTAACTPY